MGTLLESAIKAQVAGAFKGLLLTGTLRRESSSSVDSYGDPASPTAATYTFDGIRDNFSKAYAVAAGIPETDVRILVIAGSLSVTPKEEDQINIAGAWYEVRKVLEIDPAGATYTLQAFEIEAPA